MPEEQLHCTLRFIGDVERHVAQDVAASLDQVRHPPIDARIDGVGQFTHRRRGALWARLAPKDPLERLHEKVDRAIVRCGLAPERRAYLPHVTLARWSGGSIDARAWKENWAGLVSQPVRIAHFTLFESRLYRDGPVNDPVLDVTLR